MFARRPPEHERSGGRGRSLRTRAALLLTALVAGLLLGALVTGALAATTDTIHGGPTTRAPSPPPGTSTVTSTSTGTGTTTTTTTPAPSAVCPREDAGAPVRSPAPGSAKTMVPGRPVSLTVCAYNGMNVAGGIPQFGLEAVGVTASPTAINRLVTALNALKPAPRGATSCPADEDADVVASFAYAHGRGDVVTADRGGCLTITNGHITRFDLSGPGLAKQLSALTAPVILTWPTISGEITACSHGEGCARARNCSVACLRASSFRVAAAGQVFAFGQIHSRRFKLRLAEGGRLTVSLYGAGEHVNRRVKLLRAYIRARGTTRVKFVAVAR